jgi:hypothetical protein
LPEIITMQQYTGNSLWLLHGKVFSIYIAPATSSTTILTTTHCCVSITTMLRRTHHNVTLYVHCLSVTRTKTAALASYTQSTLLPTGLPLHLNLHKQNRSNKLSAEALQQPANLLRATSSSKPSLATSGLQNIPEASEWQSANHVVSQYKGSGVHFIVAPSAAALSHSKPASPGTSRDSCRAQSHDRETFFLQRCRLAMNLFQPGFSAPKVTFTLTIFPFQKSVRRPELQARAQIVSQVPYSVSILI